MAEIYRCGWSNSDPLYIEYHDNEWGVPLHDDNKIFEFIVLEGAQAGLSWMTILRKREGYRKAFADFDPEKVARFTEKKIEKLLQDSSIIRNKLKVNSAVTNAKAFLKVQEEFGSFDKYIWGFTDGTVIQNKWKSLKEIPAKTKESDALSKDLIKRGFKFVGSTIMYAHMQATGMVNDHVVECFRHKELLKQRGAKT
jgi:DNA-3-methyladenine glycosylase I